MRQDAFAIQNAKDWKQIHHDIFGENIPNHYEWTEIDDIISVLNKIGKIKNSNHLFFPDSGGLDLSGAKRSEEVGAMEILASFNYIVNPQKLIFEQIDNDCEWNYFRLETNELEHSGVYNDYHKRDYCEEILELSPGKYVERYYWDMNEYDNKPLPATARVVIRYFKGSFVIFRKASIYNSNRSTYDARHEKMGAEAFNKHILDASKSIT